MLIVNYCYCELTYFKQAGTEARQVMLWNAPKSPDWYTPRVNRWIGTVAGYSIMIEYERNILKRLSPSQPPLCQTRGLRDIIVGKQFANDCVLF